MARGPRGEWRPPDPVARAVHIGRIATGEIEETFEPPRRAAAPTPKKSGPKGPRRKAESN